MMMTLDVNCNIFSPKVLVESSVFEFGQTRCCKWECHRENKRNFIVDSDDSARYD